MKKLFEKHNNWFFRAGFILTAVMVFIVLLGQIWTPYDPSAMDAAAKAQGPTLQHLLGTDYFGRDIFSRILEGAGATLQIAFFVVLIGAGAGTLVGALTGYFGGVVDTVIMRITDIFLAMPPLVFALTVSAALGTGLLNGCRHVGLCGIGETVGLACPLHDNKVLVIGRDELGQHLVDDVDRDVGGQYVHHLVEHFDRGDRLVLQALARSYSVAVKPNWAARRASRMRAARASMSRFSLG